MPEDTCSAPDCVMPVEVRKRGLCKRHYAAWWHSIPGGVRSIPGVVERVERPCSAEGCERVAVIRDWCRPHYMRWWKSQERAGTPCGADGCGSLVWIHGRCRAHQAPCAVPDCETPSFSWGLCQKHYTRRIRYADVEVVKDRFALRWAAFQMEHPCSECGEPYLPAPGDPVVMHPKCKKAQKRRVAREKYTTADGLRKSDLRRARERGSEWERVAKGKIFERDGWRCQICGGKTRGRYPSPLSASLDHIVPVSKGGGHVASNMQTAHLRCNLQKSTGATNDQLRLVG